MLAPVGLFKRKLTPEQRAAQDAADQREIEGELQKQPLFVFPSPSHAAVLQHKSRDGSPVPLAEPPFCFDEDGHPAAAGDEAMLGRWRLNYHPAPTLFGVYTEQRDGGGVHGIGPLTKMTYELGLTDKYLRLVGFDGEITGWGQLSYWHQAGLHLVWPLEGLDWLEVAEEGFAIGTFTVKATMDDGELLLPYLTAREINRCDEQWEKQKGGDDRQGFFEALAKARCALPGSIEESRAISQSREALRSREPLRVIFDVGVLKEQEPARAVWAAWA